MSGIYTIWLREMIRFFRDKPRMFGNLSMPFIWLVLMGTGLSSSFTLNNSAVDYFTFIGPGVIAMSILFTSVFSGVSVIWDKQFGFMKEILVAPVSRMSIVLGKILGSATSSVITGLMVLIITIVFGAIPLSNISFVGVLLAIVFMILIAFCFVAIGLAIAAKLNSMEGFHMIMSFLVMPLFFLSGAFFPLTDVPTWMRILSYCDPLMYGVDGIRGALIGANVMPLALNMVVLLGFGAVLVAFSSWLFRKMRV